MRYKRRHHQVVAQLLRTLNGPLLRGQRCLFGGGTAIAMRFGEYRESVDVDFLVSDADSYRCLRQLVRSHDNLDPLLRETGPRLETPFGIRADQYGIRAQVMMVGIPVKLEIVHEARMSLDAPTSADELCGIATLTRTDMAASKLLANSDRGLDGSTFNRDLLDLAMLEADTGTLKQALAKAEAAYGDDIRRDVAKSVERLRARDGWLQTCMQRLSIEVPRATVWARVRKLERRVVRANGA